METDLEHRQTGTCNGDVRAGVFLSVVIPAYNEAQRIPAALKQVELYLEGLGKPHEIVVVDDGSTDRTAEVVEQISREVRSVRLVRNPGNCGKGAAVRNGMLHASGEYLLLTDADLSAPIAEADRLLEPLENGADIVIGSRALRPEWIGVHQSRFRESAGRLFNFFLRHVTGLEFRDTQCGFKAFRRQAAEAIFPLQRSSGFGFDVEDLYLARKLGFRAIEVPVHWEHSAASKVNPIPDGVRMALDVLKIRWNDWRGRYEAGSRE